MVQIEELSKAGADHIAETPQQVTDLLLRKD